MVARAGQCSERGGGHIRAEHLGDRQQAAAAAHKGERSARRRHWLGVIQPEPPTEHRRRLRRRRCLLPIPDGAQAQGLQAFTLSTADDCTAAADC